MFEELIFFLLNCQRTILLNHFFFYI
jgi:hypothetical protein